ncbi:TPA: hypothetical protein ACH3X3_004124 [Trebouxia sp. C0006]
MEHPQVPEGSSSLIQLPDELLAAVINTLTRHALGNPGDVCRLMLELLSSNWRLVNRG